MVSGAPPAPSHNRPGTRSHARASATVRDSQSRQLDPIQEDPQGHQEQAHENSPNPQADDASTERGASQGMDPMVYQQMLDIAMQAAGRMMKARESDMVTILQTVLAESRGQHSSHPGLPPFEQGLLRSLTQMPEFSGEGTKTWDEFQQEFVNRAAMIPSLPKTEWVRYIHSRITGRALDHAHTGQPPLQDAQGNLRTNNFEEYCSEMRDAMFGAAKTPTALLHELCYVRQEGKFADADAFLREKERILKKLPPNSLEGWAKASLVIMGMDPLLVAAISPNPHSKDGQYHSYEDLRKAVVATVGLNQLLLPNPPQTANTQGWQRQGQKPKFNGQSSPRYAPYPQGNSNKSVQQGKPHANNNKNSGNDGAGPSGSKQIIGKWADVTCADCGIAGHKSKGFKDCPKHVPLAQFQQKDKADKGKAKA